MAKSKGIGRGGKRLGAGRPPKPKLPMPDDPSTVGVDPASVDPRRILAGIAIDPNEVGSTRVAAAKALMKRGASDDDAAALLLDADLNARAIEGMKSSKRAN